ncbi:MAG TPA: hypothetical protein VGX03_00200 [Candidatus Binatia bacterium]|jgi:hypothetical protein|nr:hypothetical protein [Candidatus Binatia bacterium]
MLRLPEPDYGLSAGCNFAITQVLLGAISGVSTTLFMPSMHSSQSGLRFKNLLVKYYPWDLESPQSIAPKQAAEVLYAVFRNPLAHDLGLALQKKAMTRKVLIKRLTTKNGTRGLPEETIEGIENTYKRFQMSATLTVQNDATILLVEALYWGVRVMLERLTKDTGRMQNAEVFLASL